MKNLKVQFWDNRGINNDFITAGFPTEESDPSNRIRGHYRTKTELKHLKRMIELKGKTLLDLGCGTGRMSFQFAKYCKKVVGIDFSKELIKHGEKRKKEKNVNNIDFFVGDISSLNIEQKFDIIFLGGVLMCIDNDSCKNIINSLLAVTHEKSIVVNRDTLSLKEKFVRKYKDTDEIISYYRHVEDYLNIFADKYDTFYVSETYPFVIFFNLYYRLGQKLRKSKIILNMLRLGLILQAGILDPLLLKNKWIYRRISKKWKTKQYYFFHKIRNNDKELSKDL